MVNLLNGEISFSFFEKIVIFLQKTAERPKPYGFFHILFVFLVFAITVFLCLFCSKITEKKFRLVIAIVWIGLVVFELYKQIICSFNPETGEWDYIWSHFPFQFCSAPLYIFPFLAFFKDGNFRDGVITFTATFIFFAGFMVYLLPQTVFLTDYLGCQIQTMVHHGTQIVFGVFVAVYYREKLTKKNFLTAIYIFLALLIIAIILNCLMHLITEEYFNMFYVSPYYDFEIPLIGSRNEFMPIIPFICVYASGFILAGYLVFVCMKKILNHIENIKNTKTIKRK